MSKLVGFCQVGTLTGSMVLVASGLWGGCEHEQEQGEDSPSPTASSPTPSDDATDTPEQQTGTPGVPSPTPGGESPTPSGIVTLTFARLMAGETEFGDFTCSSGDPVECCRELHVDLSTSQEELEAQFASVLPDVTVPAVDFSIYAALLSYTTKCPGDGNHLTVDDVLESGSALSVAETLFHDSSSAAVVVRPYNLVTIPIGGYSSAAGSLTEVYEDEASAQ